MSSIFGFLKTTEAIKKDYVIETTILGQGKFAKVYKCRSREDGTEYACKVILKEKCLEDDEDQIQGEINIMKKVKHPNCIAFQDMYESTEKLYIVMELMTGCFSRLGAYPDFFLPASHTPAMLHLADAASSKARE